MLVICVSDKKDFTFVKFITQIFTSADKSLTDERRLLLLWVGLLVTLHTSLFVHITSVVKLVHIFVARSRVSKCCFKTNLCFHRFMHFGCAAIYIFGFTTNSVLAIRKITLLWGSSLRFSVILMSPKERNASATFLSWFASNTARLSTNL